MSNSAVYSVNKAKELVSSLFFKMSNMSDSDCEMEDEEWMPKTSYKQDESIVPWLSIESHTPCGFLSQTSSNMQDCMLSKKLNIGTSEIINPQVHGLALPLHELKKQATRWTTQIYNSAGPSFEKEIADLSGLKNDDVHVCNGHDLQARFVVLVGEPKFSEKYPEAAEYTLHCGLRKAMQTAAELKLRSIAMVPFHNESFPILTATHTTLRTVKKCLEILNQSIDSVTLMLGHNTNYKSTYLSVLPLYFPRNANEATKSLEFLSAINCDQWGETVKEERAIRITAFNNLNFNTNNSTDDCLPQEQSEQIDVKENMFSAMSGDHDSKRRRKLIYTNTKEVHTQKRIYQRLLRHARTTDLSVISNCRALYTSGKDVAGNEVVVIVGRNIPFCSLNSEKVLLYIIKCLDELVNSPFTVVYFHTSTTDYNHPPMEFLRKVYNTVDDRYKRNLVKFCVIHGTMWSKINAWFFSTFSASGLRNKIINIPNIPALYSIVTPDQINVPAFILEHDMKENHAVYRKSRNNSVQKGHTPPLPRVSADLQL